MSNNQSVDERQSPQEGLRDKFALCAVIVASVIAAGAYLNLGSLYPVYGNEASTDTPAAVSPDESALAPEPVGQY